MDPKLLKALNEQINAEMYSSYLYLSMATDCADKGFAGFCNWFKVQAQEEMVHAMKIYDYVLERGEKVIHEAIAAPPSSWETPLQIFTAAYDHEKHVSGLIRGVYKVARDVFDPATEIFLQWFISEQVEEEANASEVVQQIKMAEGVPAALLMLDKDLAGRPLLFTVAPGHE